MVLKKAGHDAVRLRVREHADRWKREISEADSQRDRDYLVAMWMGYLNGLRMADDLVRIFHLPGCIYGIFHDVWKFDDDHIDPAVVLHVYVCDPAGRGDQCAAGNV